MATTFTGAAETVAAAAQTQHEYERQRAHVEACIAQFISLFPEACGDTKYPVVVVGEVIGTSTKWWLLNSSTGELWGHTNTSPFSKFTWAIEVAACCNSMHINGYSESVLRRAHQMVKTL